MRVLAATRDGERRSLVVRCFVILLYLAAIAAAGTAFAQQADEKPKPRTVTLKTKDGIELRAFYFPSDRGKEAVTVLLVHEWQGQASPYAKLVKALSEAGCAVLVPDYRGHGGSREFVNARGQKENFDIAQMSKRDVENIIAFDLETSKKFLKDENNEELLNLNALVVIGIREGCVMAAHWTQRDWSFPSVGSQKQGQDVKALVFISPDKQVKGLGIDSVITAPAVINLPMMIVAGASSTEASEARRLGKRVEGIKKRIGRGEASGFELSLLPTNLSGQQLVNEVAPVVPGIVTFIKNNVKVSDDENPWVKRD
jgi:pimeloyl-ACP methyl ester carboxylesterase